MKQHIWVTAILLGSLVWSQERTAPMDSTVVDSTAPATYLILPEHQKDMGHALNQIISTSVTNLGQNVAETPNLATLYASDSLFCDSDSCLKALGRQSEAGQLIAWTLKADKYRATFTVRLYDLESGLFLKSRKGIYPADPKLTEDFVNRTVASLLETSKPVLSVVKKWISANRKTSGYILGGVAAIAVGYKLFSGKSSTKPGIGQPPEWPQP